MMYIYLEKDMSCKKIVRQSMSWNVLFYEIKADFDDFWITPKKIAVYISCIVVLN